MGITWNEFWDMNPVIIQAHVDGRRFKLNEQNALAHLNGIYTRDALIATVGNMFKKKGAKDYEYPAKPYELDKRQEEELQETNKELTDGEKAKKTEDLFKTLRLMQANFNITHGIDNGDSE